MVDEKFWRENKNEYLSEMYLVGWGRRKINGKTQVFST